MTGKGIAINTWKGIRQVVWPFRIYARDDDGCIIRDNTGKPVISFVATTIARMFSVAVVLYAADNGLDEIFGVTIKELIHMIIFV